MKIFISIFATLLFAPMLALAQAGYSPLVDLGPAANGNQIQSFEQYINFLYGMSIAIAALLAVIKIIIAGAKYMLSDVISNKGEALDDIKGAILGLLLIISAVIILELINPQLTNKSIQFQRLQSERGDVQALAVQTAANADGSVAISGAPTDSAGNLLRPQFIKRTMSCYGNWCPQQKYVTWSGTIFAYNLEQDCTDYLQENPNLGKEACILGISRALTMYDGPEPDHYGFCYENAAKGTSVTGGVVRCQLPTVVKDNAYFEAKFREQQANRSTDDIATNGASRSYDEEEDFETMCKAETYNGQTGAFKMISDDILDFEEQYYRCVWYN